MEALNFSVNRHCKINHKNYVIVPDHMHVCQILLIATCSSAKHEKFKSRSIADCHLFNVTCNIEKGGVAW